MGKPDFRLAEALGQDRVDKRLDILRRIQDAGSISEAARGAGVSYKAAWQALETLANLAGTNLVEKAVGGTGGGGARLTTAGRQVLEVAGRLERARAAVLAELDREHDSDDFPDDGPGGVGRDGPGRRAVVAFALRTSLRNQLPCRVGLIRTVGPLVRVGLRLDDETHLGARITRESAQLLGLAPGLRVLALCKATAVTIAADVAARPDHNRLAGTVARRSRARAGVVEVSLALPSGLRVVGFAAVGQGLAVGTAAAALVEETGVVIALGG